MARLIDSLNGVTVAYVIGMTNALLALLFTFGVQITSDQRSALTGFVNAALVLVAHVSHASARRQALQQSETPTPPGVQG